MRRNGGARHGTLGRILRGGVAAAALTAGYAYLATQPDDVELAQATGEPAADACGARPPKPSTTTTTTSASTTAAPTSSTAPATTSSTEPPTTSTAPATTTTAGPEATSSTLPASSPGDPADSAIDPFASTTVPTSTSAAVAAPTTGAPVTGAAHDTHWRCSLVEEFDGVALDRSRWVVQTTTGSNFGVGGECFVDSPNNIAVGGGTLKLTVRQEAAPIHCPRYSNPGFSTPVTAGSIILKPELDQTYGRYEIRARMPATTAPGLHFAFWLWPRNLANYPVMFGDGDQDKWTNGELDVLEWYSRYPYHQVPFIHYAHSYVQQPSTGKWYPDDPNLTKACLVGNMADWHTYALEWTPTHIRILYDGKVCIENTRWTPRNTTMPGPFDKPFMVALTQALGAIGTQNQAGSYTPLPASAEVDYLKIWR